MTPYVKWLPMLNDLPQNICSLEAETLTFYVCVENSKLWRNQMMAFLCPWKHAVFIFLILTLWLWQPVASIRDSFMTSLFYPSKLICFNCTNAKGRQLAYLGSGECIAHGTNGFCIFIRFLFDLQQLCGLDEGFQRFLSSTIHQIFIP